MNSKTLLRHVLYGFATLLVVSFVMFIALFLTPDPLEQLRADPQFTAADIARIVHQLGWDRPWWQQYLSWLWGALHGNFGTSYLAHRSVASMIAQRLPITLLLAGSAQMLSVLIAVPVGLLMAQKRDSALDHGFSAAAFTFMAMPNFFIALLLQLAALEMLYATGHLPLLTAGGPVTGSLVEYARRLALPILTLTGMQVARWSRYLRAEAIETIDADHVTVARSKGLTRNYLLGRHVLPNSLLPVVTVVAVDVAGLLGGSVVVEKVFDLPGIGNLLLSAVQDRDALVALDVVMLGVIAMILANIAADVICGLIDPRSRLDDGATT